MQEQANEVSQANMIFSWTGKSLVILIFISFVNETIIYIIFWKGPRPKESWQSGKLVDGG